MRTISEQKGDPMGVALIGSSRILQLARVLGGILFLVLLNNPTRALSAILPPGQSVTLAWIQSSDTNVVGYRMYYGVASRTYTNRVDVGNATSATIVGLVQATTYYFAATAYNSLEVESAYSNEASYTVPSTFASLQIRASLAGQMVLTVTGPIGQTYALQATRDFRTWTVIGTVTVGAGGSSSFTDTNAASFSTRYYRAQQ